jgi:hypothetical protein
VEPMAKVQYHLDEILQLPQGSGKTWMLNRVIRYIKRCDPSVEDLDG